MKTVIAAMLCTAVASLLSTNASAVTVHHVTNGNAAGVCAAAFSDQVVRNRPTGVRNTGTAAIYVTCSVPGDAQGSKATSTYIRVANFGTGSQTVSCNFQPGFTNSTDGTTYQGSFGKSILLTANAYNWLTFTATDYPATSAFGFQNANFTCLLQPNTEIQYIGFESDVEVGS